MTVLTTVLIAIASALIAYVIGYCNGVGPTPVWIPPTEPKKDKTIPESVVTTIIMPTRIGRDTFTKRVNKALKDTIIKAFSVCMIQYNDETVDRMFVKLRALLPCLEYDEYRPCYPRLDIVCRTCASLEEGVHPIDLQFDAVWSRMNPDDVVTKKG